MNELDSINNDSLVNISLDDLLDSVLSINNVIEKSLTDTSLKGVDDVLRVATNASLSVIHYAMQQWGSGFIVFDWFGATSYSYFNALALVGGLSGWSYSYVETVYKTNLVNQINKLEDMIDTGYTSGIIFDYDFIERFVRPRIIDAYNRAKGFRDAIILYVNSLNKYAKDNRTYINDIQKSIALLNSTFNKRVDDLIEVWFESWYAYWDYWYNTQWKTLIDELVTFKIEYDESKVIIEERLNNIQTESADLDDIRKRLYTPFSNVMEIKKTDRESFDYQLHLLRELVIEALALDFPSIRETMIENIDTILGKKQVEKIIQEVENVRPQTTVKRNNTGV